MVIDKLPSTDGDGLIQLHQHAYVDFSDHLQHSSNELIIIPHGWFIYTVKIPQHHTGLQRVTGSRPTQHQTGLRTQSRLCSIRWNFGQDILFCSIGLDIVRCKSFFLSFHFSFPRYWCYCDALQQNQYHKNDVFWVIKTESHQSKSVA